MSGRRVLFWFAVVCVVVFVLSNPASAAGLIRSAFYAGATFIQTLASGSGG